VPVTVPVQLYVTVGSSPVTFAVIAGALEHTVVGEIETVGAALVRPERLPAEVIFAVPTLVAVPAKAAYLTQGNALGYKAEAIEPTEPPTTSPARYVPVSLRLIPARPVSVTVQ